MRKSHLNYYIIEASILGLGFFIAYSMQTLSQQTASLIFLVVLYTSMGLIHHKIDHDINPRIVLEYIIISILVVSLFIFLKSSNI